MALLSFLKDDPALSLNQLADVNAILKSALHMQRLVNDVLDLAKLREGSLEICIVEVTVLCFGFLQVVLLQLLLWAQ